MGREHDDRAFGYGLGLLNEDRTPLLERAHHMSVMYDLLANVHRRAETFDRYFHRLHCPVDAGTVATGLCKQHTARLGWHGP